MGIWHCHSLSKRQEKIPTHQPTINVNKNHERFALSAPQPSKLHIALWSMGSFVKAHGSPTGLPSI